MRPIGHHRHFRCIVASPARSSFLVVACRHYLALYYPNALVYALHWKRVEYAGYCVTSLKRSSFIRFSFPLKCPRQNGYSVLIRVSLQPRICCSLLRQTRLSTSDQASTYWRSLSHDWLFRFMNIDLLSHNPDSDVIVQDAIRKSKMNLICIVYYLRGFRSSISNCGRDWYRNSWSIVKRFNIALSTDYDQWTSADKSPIQLSDISVILVQRIWFRGLFEIYLELININKRDWLEN